MNKFKLPALKVVAVTYEIVTYERKSGCLGKLVEHGDLTVLWFGSDRDTISNEIQMRTPHLLHTCEEVYFRLGKAC